jgi:hypothetical protein
VLVGLVVALVAGGSGATAAAGDADRPASHPPTSALARVCRGWSVPGADADTPPLPPPKAPAHVRNRFNAHFADRCLGLNQIQVIGTHNSYHLQPREPLWSALLSFSDQFLEWEYSHSPLAEQFSNEAVRQIELDVFHDPEGGLYADRKVMDLFGLPRDPGIPELHEPGYKVLHVQELDFETTCHTLVSCLEDVRTWSDAHPGHLPIAILIELKDAPIDDPLGLGFVKPLPIDAEALDALDAEIRSVFDDDRILLPDDVRGGFPTLEQAVLTRGWPTLAESRGKVLFLMDNAGQKRLDYIAGRPNLEGRVLFTNATPGQPDAAFVKRNEAVDNVEEIRELVRAGYVVRTRADIPTVEARSGDTTRRDAALASGAQWVSTDYPVPGRAESLGSDYVAIIPDGDPARCNPVNTGPRCRNEALEPTVP